MNALIGTSNPLPLDTGVELRHPNTLMNSTMNTERRPL
jgi:hypothetical protein